MDAISNLDLIVFGVIAFLGAVVSGISGAGAGFINTPLLIFLGLSPAQAISTGKLTGLSISIGALRGMKKVKIHSKKTVVYIILIALVIGMIAPFIITTLESDLYRTVLGVLLIILAPVLILKKIGHEAHEVSKSRKAVGYGVVSVALSLQAVFSGGLGTFVNVALMSFLGLSALEANVVKRYSQLVLNTMIVIGVFGTGLIIWKVAVVGITCSLIGGYIGGRIAFEKGDEFVMNILVALMFISGLYLLFGG